jgi:hypothetical protein
MQLIPARGSLRGLAALAAALAALSLSARASPNSDVATNVLLTEYVASTGARCLDGSPYELWLARSATGSANFVIDIMGGAWCGDLASCEARAYAPTNCFLGSSSAACFNADAERCADKAPEMQFSCLPACNGARWCGGLMTNGSVTNPLTHDWNKVLLPYKVSGQRVRARAARVSARKLARCAHAPFPLTCLRFSPPRRTAAPSPATTRR